MYINQRTTETYADEISKTEYEYGSRNYDTTERFKKKFDGWDESDPDLTQQFVIAIHQIRDLLETVRKERVKNEDMNVKAQEHENIIATVLLCIFNIN